MTARAKIRNGVLADHFLAHRLPTRELLGFPPVRKDRADALRGLPVAFTRSDYSMVYQSATGRWLVLCGRGPLRDAKCRERGFSSRAGALRAARDAERRISARAVQ